MLKSISIILVFFISIANAMANGPDRLYRGDTRNPAQIVGLGGFWPVGHDSPSDEQNASLLTHTEGYMGETDHTVYVSTSDHENIAAHYGGVGGYIYTIHPAGNIYDVNGILGDQSPEPADSEFSALGGIPTQQIMGWRLIISSGLENHEFGPYVENPDYRPDIYNGMHMAPTEGGAYALAGFPLGDENWLREPWRDFAPEGCNGPHNRINVDLDTCQIPVNKLAYQRELAYNKLIIDYEKVIEAPLKVIVGNETEWPVCVALFDLAPGVTANCFSAPHVRFTRSGQFQFPNNNQPKLPLCLRPSTAMIAGKHDWDYMVTVPCDELDQYQHFRITSKDGGHEITLPELSDYPVSLYGGWLIIGKRYFLGEKLDVMNNGYSRYYAGTDPYEDLIEIGARYLLKSAWWYPKFNSVPTAFHYWNYVYYNRKKHYLIDRDGRCIISHEPSNIVSSAIIEAMAAPEYCSMGAPYAKWKILISRKGDKSVKIQSYSGKTLMSWHNDYKIYPTLVTAQHDESPITVSNFMIFPWAKTALGLYDDNDVLKIYENPYRKGDSRALSRSVKSLGDFNDKMSSWVMPRGWKVTFYEGENFTGTYYIRYNSIEEDDSISDKIKSIRIENSY